MAYEGWLRIGAIDAHLDAQTVNAIIEKALKERAVSVTQMPELRQEIGEEFVAAVTPFVPVSKDETKYHLYMSGRATSDGRVYWSAVNRGYDYASYVYDKDGEMWGPAGYKNPSTPGTCPRWVEKVQPGTREWTAFINNITPLIVRRFASDE